MARRWRSELASWEIPAEILAQAPESPWGCPPQFFRAAPTSAGGDRGDATPPSLAAERALAALPVGGAVLDVGCGGGAAAFGLVPPAGHVIGVDSSADMLALFTTTAAERGVTAETVLGPWPDVAPSTPQGDVVVCHNVFYNVADLAPFAHALTNHARARVVVELTLAHPLVGLGPLWERFWGLSRPNGPTAELAAEVLLEAGIPAQLERGRATARDTTNRDRAEVVAFTRKRLCLPAERDAEIDAALGPDGPFDTTRAVLWWDIA